jgi:hypothetical protein
VKTILSILFIPQEKNNHKAKILNPFVLALLVLLYIGSQQFLNLYALARPGVLGYSSLITPEAIVNLTNQERVKAGLSPLKINSKLNESAQRKAGDMFAFDYWAHNSPSGRTPWDFFSEVGYDYKVAGENLAKDFYDNEAVLKAWMKSPSHRENIINSRYEEIGVAVINGTINGLQTTLVVQHFAKPLTAALGDADLPQTTPAPAEEVLLEQTNLVDVQPVANPLNPLLISKIITAFFFGLVIGTLILDAYLVLKKKAHRLSASNISQVTFLFIIFLLVLFNRQGRIF